jgi:hypothetical protein
VDLDTLATRVVEGPWPDRITAVRRVPDEFPGKEHPTVYAEIARRFYAPQLAPHFHLVPWPEAYRDRDGFERAYEAARVATDDFAKTDPETIAAAIEAQPRTLRIFRLIMGYTPKELADTVSAFEGVAIGDASIARLEEGGQVTGRIASALPALGRVITGVIGGEGGHLISEELREAGFRGKSDKPDTEMGWRSVHRFAVEGVPYRELLYQRFYGGAFRQLQDAGGSLKGDLLENATESVFKEHRVPYVRTLPGTQATAGARFGISVHPAPDFILHDGSSARGLLECKSAGDGGTARDKAGRFSNLRIEAQRLGGIPVLAVLEGLGWRRVNDALGPVVRDCDGRVFTTANLDEMLEVDPVRDLVGTAE